MKKQQQLNEVARFQAIAGIQAVGSLREDLATNEDSMGGGMTPDTRAALSAVTMLDANEIEDLLNGLAKYFIYAEKELTNIDVQALAQHLSQAASVLQAKTGM
jgi:hypothetical protein